MRPSLLGGERVGRRRDQHADRPAPASRLGLLEVGPGPDRAAAPRHQLQLIDVIGARRQVIAGPRLGPFVAVAHQVDPAGVEHLKQLVPLTLRELGGRTAGLSPGGPSVRLQSRSPRAANGDRDRHTGRPLPCRCRRRVARSRAPRSSASAAATRHDAQSDPEISDEARRRPSQGNGESGGSHIRLNRLDREVSRRAIVRVDAIEMRDLASTTSDSDASGFSSIKEPPLVGEPMGRQSQIQIHHSISGFKVQDQSWIGRYESDDLAAGRHSVGWLPPCGFWARNLRTRRTRLRT